MTPEQLVDLVNQLSYAGAAVTVDITYESPYSEPFYSGVGADLGYVGPPDAEDNTPDGRYNS